MGQLLYSMFARSKYGGDCAAIELKSLHSLRNASVKLHKKHQTAAAKVQKLLKLVSNGGDSLKIWMEWG